jgi:diguanylate cyclase (GGDEF)-like protein/PAS domain S-box-containing protein
VSADDLGVPSDQLLDALGVAVVVVDAGGRIVTTNRRAREQMITTDSDVEASLEPFDEHGLPIAPSNHPLADTLRTGTPHHNVLVGVRRDGELCAWKALSTQPLLDDDGDVAGAICTFVDITEQRNAQVALEMSEERFRLLAENAVDVVYRFSVGESPQFDYVNPAVESALGYTPEEFYDDPGLIVRVTHDEDVDQIRLLGADGVDSVQSMQLRMIRRDGTQVWTEHRIAPLRDASGRVVAATGIARDVTALKVKEAYLSHRALHDPLTGLPNRVLLLDRLEAALARIRRHQGFLAVLYLDLDRFKTVNDNLGHEVGDRLLQAVARRLQDTLRPSDSVGRLGGDEFAAILPDLHDPTEAMQVAERLLTAVAEPVDLGEGSLVTTVSIGVASGGDGDASAGELLRRADFAMYTAKDHGRARVESYDAPDAAPSLERGSPD